MKHLSLFFVALLLTACNTDDNNDIILPEVEPIIANARVVSNAFCGVDHYFVELFDVPTDSVPNGTLESFYSFYNWTDAFRMEDLKVFVDYQNDTGPDLRLCTPMVGSIPIAL
ncbi:MAG: hypothetical protein WBA16_01890 [Nonlabens sp.]